MSRELADYLLGKTALAPERWKRLDVYRRLVQANLLAVVQNALPITHRILGEETFAREVTEFLKKRGPATPLYPQVPGEFVDWAVAEGHPYADLMQFEWLELLAARHPANLDDWPMAPAADLDWPSAILRPNPTMHMGVFGRPVHELCETHREPPAFVVPNVYLFWRRPRTDAIEIDRIGLWLAEALVLAAESPVPLRLLAERLADRMSTDGRLVEVPGGAGKNESVSFHPDTAFETWMPVFRSLFLREGLTLEGG